MAEYIAQITTDRSTDDVFAYLASFDNTRHWDPSVISATAETVGPPAMGSVYELTLQLGRGTETLRYEIVEISAPHRVVLEANGSRFFSRDEIEVDTDATGTIVRYTAELRFKGLWKVAGPFASRALNAAGDAAINGLIRELDGRPSHAI